jgi:hypothetical protein
MPLSSLSVQAIWIEGIALRNPDMRRGAHQENRTGCVRFSWQRGYDHASIFSPFIF